MVIYQPMETGSQGRVVNSKMQYLSNASRNDESCTSMFFVRKVTAPARMKPPDEYTQNRDK